MKSLYCFYDCSGSVHNLMREDYIKFTKSLAALPFWNLNCFHFDHEALEPIDYQELDRVMRDYRGGSASFEPIKRLVNLGKRSSSIVDYGIIFTDLICEPISWVPRHYTILEFAPSFPNMANVCKTLGLSLSENRSIDDDWQPAW